MTLRIDIDKTCDGKKYVVVFNATGETDGWNDLSEPFDTYEEALEWVEKIKDNYGVYVDVPF